MRHRTKIAAAAVAAVALGTISAGSALAATPTTVPAVSTPASPQAGPTSPDSDTLQQGDQAGPDTSATAEPGAESKGETESQVANDGPGGHADPAGNVQHEFDGTE